MGAALQTFTASSPYIQADSTVPTAPQVHHVTHLLKAGSLQSVHTQTWFAWFSAILQKKKKSYSACGPALCTELGGWLWRSFINPKKQHVDRNADKSMAALAPPVTATVLCAPALLPRLFSCCDQSTGVSKWSSFSQTKYSLNTLTLNLPKNTGSCCLDCPHHSQKDHKPQWYWFIEIDLFTSWPGFPANLCIINSLKPDNCVFSV